MSDFLTWVEIDLARIEDNLEAIRKKVGKRKILVPVKANAYGHGLVQVAKYLVSLGIDYLGVARWEEGAELRENGVKIPILLLSGFLPPDTPRIIEYDLIPSLTTKEQIEWLRGEGKKKGVSIRIHVNVDTGMGRQGISREELFQILPELLSPPFSLEGIYTHFPSADVDEEFSRYQIKIFREIRRELELKGVRVNIWHMANSAGILNFPESYMDMVRPGILTYGYYPLPGIKKTIPVKPALTWKARVIHIREKTGGEGISYGRTYFTSSPCKIVTLGVGYGDGYPRALSNQGKVSWRGRVYPVVGRVCMDQIMVQMEREAEIRVGEEVTIMGGDISLEEISSQLGTIPYEILTRIGIRVRRVYHEEGKGLC